MRGVKLGKLFVALYQVSRFNSFCETVCCTIGFLFQLINEYGVRMGFWFVTSKKWIHIKPHILKVLDRPDRFNVKDEDKVRTIPRVLYLDDADHMWPQVVATIPSLSKIDCKIDPWHFLERSVHSDLPFSYVLLSRNSKQ